MMKNNISKGISAKTIKLRSSEVTIFKYQSENVETDKTVVLDTLDKDCTKPQTQEVGATIDKGTIDVINSGTIDVNFTDGSELQY